MDNCLITKRGRIVDCANGDHERICQHTFKCSLETFLVKRKGLRIKIGWPNTESLAIEYHTRKPTEPQLRIINKILRQNDYYTVILALKVIQEFRPIRNLRI